MLPFMALDAAGIQPWLWNGPSTPLGLLELGTVGDGPSLEPVGATVAGRRAVYGEAGHGPPVLFLHGWGLSFRAYQRSLRRLTAAHYRVVAPSLPGFGGTANLPSSELSLTGYATWLEAFLDEVGLTDPMFVIGHGLGAGVGVQFAHDHPERVSYLALVHTAAAWSTPRPMQHAATGNRSPVGWLTDWWKQLVPFPEGFQTVQAATTDLMMNALGNSWTGAQIARMGHDSDVTEQLEALRARGVGVLSLSNEDDLLVPDGCFETLVGVMGPARQQLDGTTSWVLTDPDAFEAVVQRVAKIQRAKPWQPSRRSASREVLDLLATTDLPAAVAEALVTTASPLWLMTEQPDVLAADLALCHPPLEPGEVRAAARPVSGSTAVRLTVVATDRPGLLADTAALLAVAGHSVTAASACSWLDRELALHALTFEPGTPLDAAAWDALGDRLRVLGHRTARTGRTTKRGRALRPHFEPIGAATVTVNGHWPADSVVEVSAPDTVGLLWAICQWFADQGITIVSANATTTYGTANDGFIVQGVCDQAALAAHLSPPEPP